MAGQPGARGPQTASAGGRARARQARPDEATTVCTCGERQRGKGCRTDPLYAKRQAGQALYIGEARMWASASQLGFGSIRLRSTRSEPHHGATGAYPGTQAGPETWARAGRPGPPPYDLTLDLSWSIIGPSILSIQANPNPMVNDDAQRPGWHTWREMSGRDHRAIRPAMIAASTPSRLSPCVAVPPRWWHAAPPHALGAVGKVLLARHPREG